MEADSTGFNFTVGSLRHTSGFLNRRIDFRAELGLIKAALLYADKVHLCSVGASWVRSFDHIGHMSVSERAALLKELGPELATDLTSKELKHSYHLLDQLQGPETILYRPRAGTNVKYALEVLDHEWPKLTSYVESVFDSWQVHEYRAALDSDLMEVEPFRSTTPAALCRQGLADSKYATEKFSDDAYTEYEETIKTAVSQGETYPLLDDLTGDLINEAVKNGLVVPTAAHKLSRHGGLSGNLPHIAKMLTYASIVAMRAYSEDLRQKIVDAVEQRGMNKCQAARTFDVSLATVKRYTKKSSQGLSLAPGKAPGAAPKMDEKTRKLLEEDVKQRPTVTLEQRRQYLRAVAGMDLSRSVICRAIKRMRSTRKKGQ